MSARENAKHTLVYYIRILFERTGISWTSDTRSEVEGIIDDIIDAGLDESRLIFTEQSPES